MLDCLWLGPEYGTYEPDYPKPYFTKRYQLKV